MVVEQTVGKTMTAMLLEATGQPLRAATVPVPEPRRSPFAPK
jgi:hypothetical protein